MNWLKNKKTLASFVAGLFVLTGTYNAVVINSESHISSDVKFVKRLDEVYGVTVAGREVAATIQWQKIAPAPVVVPKKIIKPEVVVAKKETTPTPEPEVTIPAAAVQEEISLSLVEVINPNKWKQGLAAAQFNGTLSANDGVIEDLNVSLPNGQGIAVSFTEMRGNVFEYDLDGELYSGMLYQVDQNAYMVTLTNGPLQDTRLRFSTQSPAEEQHQTQQYLAENNVEAGNFGNDQYQAQVQELSPEEMMANDQRMQQEAMQAQSFNFDQQQAM
jgi:hypothetical protein